MTNRMTTENANFEAGPFTWTGASTGGGATFSVFRNCNPSVSPPNGNCYGESLCTGGGGGAASLISDFFPVDPDVNTFRGKVTVKLADPESDWSFFGYLSLELYDEELIYLDRVFSNLYHVDLTNYPVWNIFEYNQDNHYPEEFTFPVVGAEWGLLYVEAYPYFSWNTGDRFVIDEFYVGEADIVIPTTGTKSLRKRQMDR